jgi:hypothetical protein
MPIFLDLDPDRYGFPCDCHSTPAKLNSHRIKVYVSCQLVIWLISHLSSRRNRSHYSLHITSDDGCRLHQQIVMTVGASKLAIYLALDLTSAHIETSFAG